MNSQFKLTIVAPVFNEAEVIGKFYEETSQVLSSLGSRFDTHLLFVVDRCSDNTLDVLKDIAAKDPRVQVVGMSSRFGHQMSLLAGIDYASDADAIIMMDSDLQHPPQLIPELVACYEKGNDIVFTIRKPARKVHLVRRVINRIFYRTLDYLSQTRINENAADFRLISRRVGDLLRTQIRERNMFLRGLFSWIGFNQVGIEYVPNDRAAGRSKYSLSHLLSFGMAGVLSFSTKPLKLSILFGFGFAFLSFLCGFFMVYEFFVDATIPSGWTTIVTLLLLFSGVQLIFVGILGAYIGGIYEEVKKRPHYIVAEKINI